MKKILIILVGSIILYGCALPKRVPPTDKEKVIGSKEREHYCRNHMFTHNPWDKFDCVAGRGTRHQSYAYDTIDPKDTKTKK